MQEMQFWSLGQEDPLEKENGNPFHYSCLENPTDREAWWAAVHGIARVGHNLVTKPPPPQDRELKDALKTVKIITVFKSIGVSFIWKVTHPHIYQTNEVFL